MKDNGPSGPGLNAAGVDGHSAGCLFETLTAASPPSVSDLLTAGRILTSWREESLVKVVHRKETDGKSSASLWGDEEAADGPCKEKSAEGEDDELKPTAEESSADAAAQQEEGSYPAEGTSREEEMDAEATPEETPAEETPEITQLAAASIEPNLDLLSAAEAEGPGQEAECCPSCHAAPPAGEEVMPPAALRCEP